MPRPPRPAPRLSARPPPPPLATRSPFYWPAALPLSAPGLTGGEATIRRRECGRRNSEWAGPSFAGRRPSAPPGGGDRRAAGRGRSGTALVGWAAAFGGARRRRGPFVLPGLGQRSTAPSDRLSCRMRPGVGLGAPMCADAATSAIQRLCHSNGPLYTSVQTRGCRGPSVEVSEHSSKARVCAGCFIETPTFRSVVLKGPER